MTTLMLILTALLLLAAVAATLVVAHRDGRGPAAPPRSHPDDRRLPWATA